MPTTRRRGSRRGMQDDRPRNRSGVQGDAARVPYHTVVLKVRIVRDYEDMSRRASAHVLAALRRHPDLLLGAVTGDSPRETYRRLVRARARAPRLFRRLRVLAMDEWTGLPRGHEATCEAFVRKEIVGPLKVSRSRWQSWRSDAPDRRREARRVSRWLGRE